MSHNHEHHHHGEHVCGEHHHDEHCHCHGGEENRKVMFIRLAGGFLLTLLILFLPVPPQLALIPYLVLGYDVIFAAVKNTLHGEFFDEVFLMSVATVGAIALGEYTEACAVMFFYQVGELLSDFTADRCRTSIKNMFDFAPDSARRITDSGFETVSPESLKPGDRIAVFAGEKIPCDGFVYSGDSYVDSSALTGESVPVHIKDGSKVLGGCINLDSPIELRTSAEYKDSSVAKVVRMLEAASENKSRSERFITSFSKKYTPAVVLIALLSALLLPLFPGFTLRSSVYTAMTFLVVSCPCALVISIPLTLFSGIGRASANKILFRSNSSLEALHKIKNFAFDKTGTLTSGKFGIEKSTLSQEDFALLTQLERHSRHPLSGVLAERAEKPYKTVSAVTEVKGMGICAEIDGKKLVAGNEKIMELNGIKNPPCAGSTVIHFAADGVYKGYVSLSDGLKSDSAEVIGILKKRGAAVALLSGDTDAAVKKTAEAAGIENYRGALLPEDKLRCAGELKKHGALAYVGDGINDAPVLALADIGISMGGAGSDIAIANSDVILLDDNLKSLELAVDISKKTMRIVYQNIFFSLGVKLVVMILGFLKLSSMPLAIFADVGVMLLAVLNSMRAMR